MIYELALSLIREAVTSHDSHFTVITVITVITGEIIMV